MWSKGGSSYPSVVLRIDISISKGLGLFEVNMIEIEIRRLLRLKWISRVTPPLPKVYIKILYAIQRGYTLIQDEIKKCLYSNPFGVSACVLFPVARGRGILLRCDQNVSGATTRVGCNILASKCVGSSGRPVSVLFPG